LFKHYSYAISEASVYPWSERIIEYATYNKLFDDPLIDIENSLSNIKMQIETNIYDGFNGASLYKKIENIIKSPGALFDNKYIRKILEALDNCLAQEIDKTPEKYVYIHYGKDYSDLWLEIVGHAENMEEFQDTIVKRLELGIFWSNAPTYVINRAINIVKSTIQMKNSLKPPSHVHKSIVYYDAEFPDVVEYIKHTSDQEKRKISAIC
jgi:hypothetical protein